MKKTILLTLLLSKIILHGQIGIGTAIPRGALDINRPTTNTMGLVLPTNANVNNIINPLGTSVVPGTIIYDSTNDCVRLYQGTNKWSNCLSDSSCATIVLDCSGATHTGMLTSGTAASANVFTIISYTGGDGSSYNAQSIGSTGVTGLTATLPAGTLANGNGSLTYTITGTPSSAGTASFAINIGGQTCTITRNVVSGAGSISTLDCVGANHIGTLTSQIAASGVSSVISYTGGNGGSHNGQTIMSTGVTGLTATLAAGNFAIGTGTVTYNITGTPSSAGTASFAINIGGQTCIITRNIVANPNPPQPDLTTNCKGILLDSKPVGSVINTTINGVAVTGTYLQNDFYKNDSYTTPSTACGVGANLIPSNTPGYTTHLFAARGQASITGTIRIKFNNPVTNLKAYEFLDSPGSSLQYTFRKDGVIVYPTIQYTSTGCPTSYTVTNGSSILVRTNSGVSRYGAGMVFNMGGVWFDDITIVKTSAGTVGLEYQNYLAMCLGDVK